MYIENQKFVSAVTLRFEWYCGARFTVQRYFRVLLYEVRGPTSPPFMHLTGIQLPGRLPPFQLSGHVHVTHLCTLQQTSDELNHESRQLLRQVLGM